MTETTDNRVLLFTGNGKGKTTAALGMVLRAVGHGLRVLIVQFIKSDDSTGEIKALRHFSGVETVLTGQGFLPPKDSPEFFEHKKAAINGLRLAAGALASGEWDMVLLDEVAGAVHKGLLPEQDVIDAVNEAAVKTIVVLTGRNASDNLAELADTVTEMRLVKHGYSANKPAQKGVEF